MADQSARQECFSTVRNVRNSDTFRTERDACRPTKACCLGIVPWDRAVHIMYPFMVSAKNPTIGGAASSLVLARRSCIAGHAPSRSIAMPFHRSATTRRGLPRSLPRRAGPGTPRRRLVRSKRPLMRSNPRLIRKQPASIAALGSRNNCRSRHGNPLPPTTWFEPRRPDRPGHCK